MDRTFSIHELSPIELNMVLDGLYEGQMHRLRLIEKVKSQISAQIEEYQASEELASEGESNG